MFDFDVDAQKESIGPESVEGSLLKECLPLNCLAEYSVLGW